MAMNNEVEAIFRVNGEIVGRGRVFTNQSPEISTKQTLFPFPSITTPYVGTLRVKLNRKEKKDIMKFFHKVTEVSRRQQFLRDRKHNGNNRKAKKNRY